MKVMATADFLVFSNSSLPTHKNRYIRNLIHTEKPINPTLMTLHVVLRNACRPNICWWCKI